jgi:hypothetical protein
VRRNKRNTSWWNQGLAVKRRKVRKLFNAAKKSGDWTDYKRTLTDNNKALRQAKRESCRRQFEETEKALVDLKMVKVRPKHVVIGE